MKDKKQELQQQKEEEIRQSDTLKASVLPVIGFSPGFSPLTKNASFTSPAKLCIANTSSTSTITNKIWSKFMDQYKSYDVTTNDQLGWQL